MFLLRVLAKFGEQDCKTPHILYEPVCIFMEPLQQLGGKLVGVLLFSTPKLRLKTMSILKQYCQASARPFDQSVKKVMAMRVLF
jgi:hypothetical protein